MNKNIDLTKILRNCPVGWKFYSSIYGNVAFSKIDNDSDYPIKFSVIINKDKEKAEGSVTEKGLHLHSYNGECTFFPSKEQRDWNKFTSPWYRRTEWLNSWLKKDKKPKFDPKTLQPFDKVLARDYLHGKWTCGFFSHIVIFNNTYMYNIGEVIYKMCIPYNDDTKHLVGTTDEVPEYYRYWED